MPERKISGKHVSGHFFELEQAHSPESLKWGSNGALVCGTSLSRWAGSALLQALLFRTMWLKQPPELNWSCREREMGARWGLVLKPTANVD